MLVHCLIPIIIMEWAFLLSQQFSSSMSFSGNTTLFFFPEGCKGKGLVAANSRAYNYVVARQSDYFGAIMSERMRNWINTFQVVAARQTRLTDNTNSPPSQVSEATPQLNSSCLTSRGG